MNWPRKAVVIRLLIYVPVIGYLGYQGIETWKAKNENTESAKAPAGLDAIPDSHKRVIEMPDGTKQEIIELTEEEAKKYLGRPPTEDAEQ